MHTLVLEIEKNLSVAKTQEVIVKMHDGGKGNWLQKHGGKSKGKGVIDVVVIG
jgi:hypothetical protein